jgi:hypothetical protein
MSCHRHINCVLQTSHTNICLVTDTSIMPYRHHTSTYVLSQTHQLYLTDITCLHMFCHRHFNCVLQTSHAYIYLVIDKSIVSDRHYTPTYVFSKTHHLCLTYITCLHTSCHRHINCLLQTLHAYLCLVRDTSVVSYRHHTSTYVLSQTHPLCLTDITHLHISCNGHISCVLRTSHAYIFLGTDISIVSYRHHIPTYFLSQTHQLCFTDITRLHMSCHRHINCVLHTLHACICLVRDTSIVSYKHDTPTYVLSQTLQLCLTNITHLHMSCHRHIYCILQTSHVYICLVRDINCVLQISYAYICLVTDISVVSYRHYTPTYILSQTVQLYLTDIIRLHMSCHRHINCLLQTSHAYICLVTDTAIVSYRHYTSTYVL